MAQPTWKMRVAAFGCTALLALSLPVALFIWISAAYARFPWIGSSDQLSALDALSRGLLISIWALGALVGLAALVLSIRWARAWIVAVGGIGLVVVLLAASIAVMQSTPPTGG